jgi:NADPH:quinone reductase-like Zn-dependent oxidoreductase
MQRLPSSSPGRLVDAGKLKVHVERTFPLEKAGEAHAFLETR